jgi:hypothetical protein
MKDFLNKVTDKVNEHKDAVMEGFSFDKLTEKVTGMSDSAKEKSIGFMNDMIAISPIIEEIGFKTTGISVSLGLPPDVTFHFSKESDTTQEERDAMLAQHANNKMLTVVAKTLFMADSYQQKLKMGNFRFANIDVCVGLTGGVSFQLVPKG